MKKLMTSLIVLATLFVASPALAQEDCVETAVYGGGVGVVCGAKTHEPVDTAFGDNPIEIVGLLFGSSASLLYFSKRLKKASI